MLSAGQRNNRVRFERRMAGAKSASGNTLEQWSALFLRWAGFRPQFGRERLAAGRLEAGLTGTLTILACAATRGLTEADRVVFVAGPYRDTVCQIRSIAPTPDGREIEMTIDSGAQT